MRVATATINTSVATATTDISGIKQALISLFAGDATQTSTFDVTANPTYVGIYFDSFVIEASPTTNGTTDWVPLITVASGNKQSAHTFSVDLTNYVRVRFTGTGPQPGASVNNRVYLNVHDIDARDGADDGWFMVGDSLVANVWGGNNSTSGTQDKRFGYLFNGNDPSFSPTDPMRWPVFQPGDISGGVIRYALRTRENPWNTSTGDGTGALVNGGASLFAKWLANFPGRYVSLELIHNDINGVSSNFVTQFNTPGTDGRTTIQIFRSMIDLVLASGKVAVIPRTTCTWTNAWSPDVFSAWNDYIHTTILPTYYSTEVATGQVLVGPDLYTPLVNAVAAEGLAAISYDNTHLTEHGADIVRNVWLSWMFSTVYVRATETTRWTPGIPGGIPSDSDPVRPATIYLPTDNPYGGYSVDPALLDGVTDVRTAIQDALTAAGVVASETSRRVVLLPAGVARITGALNIPSYVVLRGAGPTNDSSGTRVRLDNAGTQAIRTTNTYTFTTPTYITADAQRGRNTVSVQDASAINVGDIIWIDHTDDSYIDRLPDGITQKRVATTTDAGPALPATAPSLVGDAGWRSEGQGARVTGKNGNSLTIEGVWHGTFTVARAAQVYAVSSIRRWVGVERLWVTGGGQIGNGQQGIRLYNAAYSWVCDVESDGRTDTVVPGTYTFSGGLTGQHVSLYRAYRCEVRRIYVHHARQIIAGGNAYGVGFDNQTTDSLLEDAILVHLNKPFLGRNCGPGCAVGYCHVDNAYGGTAGWQETSLDVSHAAFTWQMLIEGCRTVNLSCDMTHGNNGKNTFLRNYAHGQNSAVSDTQNIRAVSVDGLNLEHTVIGNVLNQSLPGAVYESNPTQNTSVGTPAIYRIGAMPEAGYFGTWDTGTAQANLYRHGNWDSVNAAVVWDGTTASRRIPQSYYLTTKPSFFGSSTWPWVDPAGTSGATRTQTLPATARYDSGVFFPPGDTTTTTAAPTTTTTTTTTTAAPTTTTTTTTTTAAPASNTSVKFMGAGVYMVTGTAGAFRISTTVGVLCGELSDPTGAKIVVQTSLGKKGLA